ncbi:DNA polymerase III subunit beta [Clostridium felsineum]|uniref:Beta sliding clamp n=1 Tax=Clostridium felsineum TaxID=36839 RepID=A0A1S8KY75_9CLOT|nr:DNA polymerase III subunit beta [Clostridium felsineum]URZ05967.1 Beta sliding clamp [Clostridium felsineum]URZ11004.1 Beta sliding clamp [Clostridium felsineum]
MRFSCDKNTLLNSLEVAVRAVNGRNTMKVLTGVLIDVKEGTVTITGSYLDMTISSNFKVLDFENGQTVADAKLLLEYVKKLRNGSILVFTESEKLIVKSGKSSSGFITLDSKEYPKKVINSNETQINILSSELATSIKEVLYATAKDEIRPILTGVLFEIKNGELKLVAMDGYRLSMSTVAADSEKDIYVVIPGKALKEVLKVLPKNTDTNNDKDIDVRLNISDNFAKFVIGDVSIDIRLLEGEFVKYNSIIPEEFNTSLIVNKEELNSVLDRASIMDEKNNLIKMDITENKIIVTSNSNVGSVNDEVEIKSFQGSKLIIAFNSKYWLELLSALSTEDGNIEINLNRNIDSVIIKKVNDDSFTGLILPVRLVGELKESA